MNPITDLIGSPPASPSQSHHPGSPTTPTQRRTTSSRLKRLSLVSGAVFNANESGIQEGVKDAMEENPSFGSPIRKSFSGDTGDGVTDAPDTVVDRPKMPVGEAEKVSATPSSPIRGNKSDSIPVTSNASASASRTASALFNDLAAAPAQSQPPQHPRSSQNIGRLGYRHSIVPMGGRTPLTQTQPSADARRARRRSVDRDPPPVSSESTFNIGQNKAVQPQGVEPTNLPASASSTSTSTVLRPPPHTVLTTARPLTLIEQHAPLLAYIAQKETEVHESRRLYERRSEELREAKKKWEEVVAMSSGGGGVMGGGGSPFSQPGHGNTKGTGTMNGNGNENGRTSLAAAGRIQPPMPVRRTNSSTSSIGSSSSGSLRPNTHTSTSTSAFTGTTKHEQHLHHQRNVMPLSIPLEDGTTAAAGAANAVVEGSKRLFGHLLDSLAGVNTNDDVDGELRAAGKGRGEASGAEDGRNVLVRLDESPLRRDPATERSRDMSRDDRQVGRTVAAGAGMDSTNGTMNGSGKGQGTRQIKTLSLIAGKGSTSKHNRQHQQHRAAGPDVGINEGNTHERGEQTGLIAWDMLDTSPPAASRTKQTNSKKTTLERSKWSSTSTTDDGSSPFVDDQSSERNQETAGNGAVDFGNIWDGFAATPNGKDWKAMLAPTIHSSQKKATDFISTNLSHTLDFFSQALPTPNFNTLAGHPAASSPTANRGLEADAATRALGRRPSDLEVSPMAENTRQNKGPEDEEALSGGMDIPWNW